MAKHVEIQFTPAPRLARDIETAKVKLKGHLTECDCPFFSRIKSGMAGMWAGK